jgi:predicted nucleic acid-binding protein
MKLVSNSTPLISFHQLGMLDLLRQLFGQIIIPPAVQFETFVRRPMP